jgi:hypothetical protein
MAYLDFKGLSTEAMVGKILILVGFVLKIVGAIVILGGLVPASTVSMTVGLEPFKWVLTGALTAFGLLAVAGIIVLWKAMGKFKKGDLQGVAVFSLVSAFLPPVGLELIGAILLLISPEIKGKMAAKGKK